MSVFDDDYGQDQASTAQQLQQERNEIDILLNRGIEFEAGGKKHLIKQPTLATLIMLSEQFIQVNIDKLALEANDAVARFEEHKKAVLPNARICARIVAIAVLGSCWKTKYLLWYYERYFLNSLTPSDMYKITNIILKTMNLADFMNSIVLIHTSKRVTAPQTIEE